MADHNASPDYELDDTLEITEPAQYRALFEATREQIITLLLERAATTAELAVALDKPKGTVGHHLKALEEAGLVRVVRTKRVRAIEAKYYGRTARTFLFHKRYQQMYSEPGQRPHSLLAEAAAELESVPDDLVDESMSTVRYARIPHERASEWRERVTALAHEFASQPRGGDVTYAIALGVYPTTRKALPKAEDEA